MVGRSDDGLSPWHPAGRRSKLSPTDPFYNQLCLVSEQCSDIQVLQSSEISPRGLDPRRVIA